MFIRKHDCICVLLVLFDEEFISVFFAVIVPY